MYQSLEQNAIEFTLGPSYMEDDIRMETDRTGFCGHHLELLYRNQNRLGLALMLKTHMDRIISDVESLQNGTSTPAAHPRFGSLFRKKANAAKTTTAAGNPDQPGSLPGNPIHAYLDQLNRSCFVCNRIDEMYRRYLDTIFYLYQTDESFRNTFHSCKGFCTPHYNRLRTMALSKLSGNRLDSFLKDLDQLYLNNMKRVRDDLEWFTDKFDYRNADAPWKNSKDALPRAAGKTAGPVNFS
jgi:hypothetical protein